MNINELRDKIFDLFVANGYSYVNKENRMFNGVGDKWTRDEKGHINGYTIDVEDVFRHNNRGLDNMSIDICISYWEGSSGKAITRERIKVGASEKVVANKVNKIIDAYKAI